MNWDSITAIATSLTVMVGFGAPMLMWILTKPKINIDFSELKPDWFYDFKDGKYIVGARIFLDRLFFENNGDTPSSLSATFDTELSGNNVVFHSLGNVRLESQSWAIENKWVLQAKFDFKADVQYKGHLCGTLRIKATGNKRLIFGKKYIDKMLDIPFSEGNF